MAEDLISKLPDELLARILSFIDTKSAVATTLVSKRWNRLWISVPNLDFVAFACEHPAGEARFDRFVDRVLSANKVRSVRNIHFYGWNSTQVGDAEKIQLYLKCQNYTMPDCFFNKESLVELGISYFICKVPPSARFPSLRKIHFQHLRLRDNHSLNNLLSGCPVLPHLILVVTEWDDPTRIALGVRSSSLLRLCIRIEDRLKAFYYKDARDVIPRNCIWEEPNEVPRCFATSLKRVEIALHVLKNVKKTMQMISYVLKNATVLKHMYVNVTYIEMEQENEFRKTLSTLRKGSAECQVIYEDQQGRRSR